MRWFKWLVVLVVLVASAFWITAILLGLPRFEAESVSLNETPPPDSAPAGQALFEPRGLVHQGDDAEPSNETESADSETSEEEVSKSEDLLPHEAVAKGLAGLADLYPAADEAQSELLAYAKAERWDHAVTACLAYGQASEYGVDPVLVGYLTGLRFAALYIEADEGGRLRLLGRFASWDAVVPLAHASLYSEKDDEIIAALEVIDGFDSDQVSPEMMEQLKRLTEHHNKSVAWIATQLYQRFAHGEETWISRGGFGGPGGGMGGREFRRSRGGGGHLAPSPPAKVEPGGYTVEDLEALGERYRSGSLEERVAGASIVATHAWPEATALAVEMLRDDEREVRLWAIEALASIETVEAHRALLEAYPRLGVYDRVRIFKQITARHDDGSLLDDLFRLALTGNSRHMIDRALSHLEQGKSPISHTIRDTLVRHYLCEAIAGDFGPRALRLLWKDTSVFSERELLVLEATRHAPAAHLKKLAEALVELLEKDPDEQAVAVWVLLLDRPEEALRIFAVEQLVSRYGPAAHVVLKNRVAHDHEAVVVAMLTELIPYQGWPQVRELVTSVAMARFGNEAIEAAVLELIDQSDAQMLPTLRLFLSSRHPEIRHTALETAAKLGDLRFVNDTLPLIADSPEENVIRALHTTQRLLLFEPETNVREHASNNATSTLRFRSRKSRRIVEQEAWVSALLGRLFAGDVDVAVFLIERFPRIELPTEPQRLTGEHLAQAISRQTGIQIDHGASVPSSDSIEVERWESEDGRTFEMPRSYFRRILEPALKDAPEGATPPAYYEIRTDNEDD